MKHKRVRVPNDKIGIIIGANGTMFKAIQENTGAKVQIPSNPDSDDKTKRTIVISGRTQEIVDNCHKEIFSILDRKANQTMEYVTIPNDKVGLVIGKEGINIRDLNKRLGVRFNIPQEPDPDSEPATKTITISGAGNGPKLAKQTFEQILNSHYTLINATESFTSNKQPETDTSTANLYPSPENIIMDPEQFPSLSQQPVSSKEINSTDECLLPTNSDSYSHRVISHLVPQAEQLPKLSPDELCTETGRLSVSNGPLEEKRLEDHVEEVCTESSYQHMNIPAEKIAQGTHSWGCSFCTLDNSDSSLVCEACGNTKSMAALLSAGTSWICQTCKFHNSESQELCQNCHANRRILNPLLSDHKESLEADYHSNNMNIFSVFQPSYDSNTPTSAQNESGFLSTSLHTNDSKTTGMYADLSSLSGQPTQITGSISKPETRQCSFCLEMLMFTEMKTHLEMCPLRKVACPLGCLAEFPAYLLQKHLTEFCAKRNVQQTPSPKDFHFSNTGTQSLLQYPTSQVSNFLSNVGNSTANQLPTTLMPGKDNQSNTPKQCYSNNVNQAPYQMLSAQNPHTSMNEFSKCLAPQKPQNIETEQMTVQRINANIKHWGDSNSAFKQQTFFGFDRNVQYPPKPPEFVPASSHDSQNSKERVSFPSHLFDFYKFDERLKEKSSLQCDTSIEQEQRRSLNASLDHFARRVDDFSSQNFLSNTNQVHSGLYSSSTPLSYPLSGAHSFPLQNGHLRHEERKPQQPQPFMISPPGMYPKRPGKQACDFYMKTGRCKFVNCKYDHPVPPAHFFEQRGGAFHSGLAYSTFEKPTSVGSSSIIHQAQQGLVDGELKPHLTTSQPNSTSSQPPRSNSLLNFLEIIHLGKHYELFHNNLGMIESDEFNHLSEADWNRINTQLSGAEIRRLKMALETNLEEQAETSNQYCAPPLQEGAPINSQQECIICFKNPRDAVFVPCGHNICCMQCSTKLLLEKLQCPYCREKVDQAVKMFSV